MKFISIWILNKSVIDQKFTNNRIIKKLLIKFKSVLESILMKSVSFPRLN